MFALVPSVFVSDDLPRGGRARAFRRIDSVTTSIALNSMGHHMQGPISIGPDIVSRPDAPHPHGLGRDGNGAYHQRKRLASWKEIPFPPGPCGHIAA